MHAEQKMPLHLNRRSWLALAASTAALVACGGGDDDAPSSSTAESQKLVDKAARQAVSQGLAGVAFGRIDAGGTAIATAGLRRLGRPAVLQQGDVFTLGSTTKAMTSAAIAAMVDAGLAAWTTTLAQAFPNLRGMHPAYANVTLEQLLDHRGGIVNSDGDFIERFSSALAADPEPLPDTLAGMRRYMAAWLVGQAPAAGVVPGQTFLYSNPGYGLAATMLEALTGRGFEDLFDAYLVRPLALKGRWRMASEISPDEPAGHTGPSSSQVTERAQDPEDLAQEPWERVMAPDGKWTCSAPAYAEWVRWHLAALKGQKTPLPSSYVSKLIDPTAGPYKLGWFRNPFNGRPLLLHTGQEVFGFTSFVLIDHVGSHAAFALTNTADYPADWIVPVLEKELAQVYDGSTSISQGL
jgi:D-alanyl-D-alanine carboxypeptidase